MNDKPFDLIVIGGGSGGIATANRAASYGAKVALVEKDLLGGTCVNRGCVPKKVMWYAASMRDMFNDANGYGFKLDKDIEFSWPVLKKARDHYIKRLNGLYASGLDSHRITLLNGSARFVDTHTIAVDQQHYHAKHVLIATGGAPIIPDIPGATLGGTSDDFFEMEQLPQKAVIIGAGYIAVELACVLNSLGSDVHLCLRKEQPLRTFDTVLSTTLFESMLKDGIHIHTQTEPTGIEKSGSQQYRITTNKTVCLDQLDEIFWAIGRRPYLDQLGTQNIGLELEDSGHIRIDEWQQTNIDHLYAVGDITPQAPLTPVAIAAGRHLADRLFGNKPDARLNEPMIPTAVFSHPPISTVGLTEEQAIKTYGKDNIKVFESKFTPMYYALTEHKVVSRIKMIVTGTQEKVIGFHMIGRDADEIIQGVALAMQAGVTYSQLQETIAVHPTSAEEIVLLK